MHRSIAITLLALLTVITVTGCRKDTRPVPHTLSGDLLYKDYRKQNRGYPMPARDAAAVLSRTDLKSTGDYTPSEWPPNSGGIRFIYGRSYYWAYLNNPRNPRDEPKMFGPFDLP